MKERKTVDLFVRVDTKPPRYGGYTSLDDHLSDCKEIEQQIRRHVDAFGSVSIEHTTEDVCSFCGSKWTEGDGIHNGGCCKEDEAVMIAEEREE